VSEAKNTLACCAAGQQAGRTRHHQRLSPYRMEKAQRQILNRQPSETNRVLRQNSIRTAANSERMVRQLKPRYEPTGPAQLQAMVHSASEPSINLLDHRHLELGCATTARLTASISAAWAPSYNHRTTIPQARVLRLQQNSPAAPVFCTLPAPLEKPDRHTLQCFLGRLSCRKTASILKHHVSWGLSAALASAGQPG